MLEWYNVETIPQLMQELEDIYSDLCGIVSEAIFNGADVISAKVTAITTIRLPCNLLCVVCDLFDHLCVVSVVVVVYDVLMDFKWID